VMDNGRVEPLGASGRPAAFAGLDFLFHCLVPCLEVLLCFSASYMRSLWLFGS
jgi:hypothetical protein